MIKLENTVLPSAEQWEAIIRGMRNPKNSWNRSDSHSCGTCGDCDNCIDYDNCPYDYDFLKLVIGPNDHDLMMRLAKGGPVHAKYRRMIPVYVDITAPLYWWKEFDTYKVGTVANSCSTMHKIHAKEFVMEDFSTDRLLDLEKRQLRETIAVLNAERDNFLNDGNKVWWDQMIQLLPSSYNQKRTIFLTYEVLHNIYHSRRNHKLKEWHEVCAWIESLPYSEIITLKGEPIEKTEDSSIIAKTVNLSYEDASEALKSPTLIFEKEGE